MKEVVLKLKGVISRMPLTVGAGCVWLVVGVLVGIGLGRGEGPPSVGGVLAGGIGLLFATLALLLAARLDWEGCRGEEVAEGLQRERARREAAEAARRRVGDQAKESRIAAHRARQQTMRLHAVFQQLNHPAGFLDPRGRVLELNAAAVELIGVPIGDLRGRMISELPAFGGGEAFQAPLRRAAGGETVHFQRNVQGSDEHEHTLELTLKPVPGDQAQVELLILEGHDVTERIRAEEALQETFHQFQQSQKMEAVGRLAGGIAHDFNNLLTSILGFSNMVLEELSEEDIRADLQEVILAATRGQNLTQKLLALSRKDVPDSQPVDLNQLLRDMDNLIRVTLHENIELVLETTEERCMALADPTSLEQVIINLAVNARDSMPRSGRLLIHTGRERLKSGAGTLPELAEGEYSVLSIRDTGCGMEPEVMEHVFEPFFTTKASGQGTGLGLSTVYAIMQQYEGGIRLRSEPGVGTEFVIYFPRHAGAEQMLLSLPEEKRKRTLPRGTETILLVEDEEGLRRMGARMVRSLGYTVLLAEDGEEGVRIAEAHAGKIDLIVTDVVMPNLSGPEMIDRLHLSLGYIPHLYVSGFTMDKLKEHGADDSEQNLIRKPYSREVLARRIRQLLDEAG